MIRRGSRLAPLLAVLALSAAPTPAPTVDDIVARYIAARGGSDKLRSLQSLRQKGLVIAGAGRQASVVREVKRPNRVRFEFTTQGVTSVYVLDGAKGWQVTPIADEMTMGRMTDDAMREASEQADIEGPLVDWRRKGHGLELLGRELVAGREAYKLKLTLKSGTVRYEYIDVRSGHHVRSDATRSMRGRPVQVETTFGEFKKTSGILFPRRIEVAAIGRPERTRVVVEKVEVNPPISDSRFEDPTKR